MTTYHGLDEAQRCPRCDGALDYHGLHTEAGDYERQWWRCGACGVWWSDEAIAYAAAYRIMQERLAASAAGQMTLPGVDV